MRIPVSVTTALYKKGIAGKAEPKKDTPAHQAWKNELGRKGTFGWAVREMTMAELASHVSSGLAISVGLYEKGHRARKNRVGGWLLGLDFEVSQVNKVKGVDPALGYSVEKVIADDFISPYIGVAVPSSSDTPAEPRTRVLIPFDRSVTAEEYNTIAMIFKAHFGDYLATGESRDACRFYFGSTPDPSRVYSNDAAVLCVDTFLATYSPPEPERDDDTTTFARANNYQNTEEGNERLEEHFKHTLAEREALVVEMVDWVLKNTDPKTWDRLHWLQLTMAAWHGSDGSAQVRDFILTHRHRPVLKITAAEFREQWDNHQPMEGGFTVSSLMYLAKQCGWLTVSGLEIPDQLVNTINVRYITEWLDNLKEIPERLLLQSQTGSGKTHALKSLWERLGKPKTVVFVPSIKLAMELAGTLKNQHGINATLYIDPSTGKRLDTAALLKADFLVTTLQTFATKVSSKGYSMAKYGLVYVEESDQLIQQFSKGGGGFYGSHVTDQQARAGYQCLRSAFLTAGVVWCVDATMTQVTYQLADAMRGEHPLTVVRNAWIEKKPSVTLLRSREEAYQVMLRSLEAGKRVVVACDTAEAAAEATYIMEKLRAISAEDHLLITRHTERNPRVVEFMSNVNANAGKYKFVAYNSVMASGVSVSDVKGEVVIQLSSYLTPRVNLQLLNRYRVQGEVYCFFQNQENLYTDTEKSLINEFQHRAEIEAELVGMPLADRTDDAALRFRIASISLADVSAQSRSTLAFYIGLLKSDGREVLKAGSIPVAAVIKHSLKGVRTAKKERRDYIAAHWPEVDPVDDDRPARPDATDLEVAMGEVHAEIQELLNGNVPDDVEPEELYQIVTGFREHLPALTAFLYQKEAMLNAERYLADTGKALSTIFNNVTLIKVVSLVKYLYADPHEKLTDEMLDARRDLFLGAVKKNKDAYDSVMHRERDKYDQIVERSEDATDLCLTLAKTILKKIGLKQRYARAGNNGRAYSISNIDQLDAFLGWREPENTPKLLFTMAGVEAAMDEKSDYMKMYYAMNPAKRKLVLKLVDTERYTDFATAVMAVNSGLDKF